MNDNKVKVQFYNGLESRYILEGGKKENGADVAYRPQYKNSVYFAKDTRSILVNGKRYGVIGNAISTSEEVFSMPSEVEFRYPTNDDGATIGYLDSEKNMEKTAQLFRLSSGTPETLKVDVDEEKNYTISLELEKTLMEDSSIGNNNLIVEGDRFGLYLGMKQDKFNHKIKFGSFDNKGVFKEIGSIDDTKFLLERDLKEVGITEENDSSVLRFEWYGGTVVDIPLTDLSGHYLSDLKDYISKIDGSEISVGISEDINTLAFSEFDSIATALKKIDNRLNIIESLMIEKSDNGVSWKEYMESLNENDETKP